MDVALLNKARKALGRQDIGSPGHDWLLRLNTFRHRRHNKIVNKAITTIEKMQAQALTE
ncbi:hypothetical protein [Ancylobacter dichloromethanicus]|uniref:hypothetical protein n=1 Tax=Ancylobacter dichloromethanicus TaxID=518825 RepID=UPI0036231E7F